MFLINRLIALRGTGPADLMELPCQFVSVGEQPSDVKVIFDKAKATVSSTANPHEYTLRVSPDDDPDDTLVFILNRDLRLSRYNDIAQCVVRFELDNPKKQRQAVQINTRQVQDKEVDGLEQVLCQSMFEFEFKEKPSEADMDQVMGYCRRKHANPAAHPTEGITFLEYDSRDTKSFVPLAQEIATGFSNQGTAKQFLWALTVKKSDGSVVYEELVTKLDSLQILEKNNAVVWLSRREKFRVFQLRFGEQAVFEAFRDDLTVKMYEAKKMEDSKKLKDDIAWLTGAFKQQVTMEDDDGYKESDLVDFDRDDDALNTSHTADDDDNDDDNDDNDDDDDDDDDNEKGGKGFRVTSPSADKNSSMALALKHQRAFVCRGDRIMVDAIDDDGAREVATLKVSNLNKASFIPSKFMLHQDESSLLLLDPTKESSVFRMDLERGQVVEEWRSEHNGVHVPTRDLEHSSKFSQKTSEQTFLGANKKQFFRMDPRLGSANKLVGGDDIKSYTKECFSCVATTGAGHLVVGSAKGEIRMFNAQKKINMNAKTTLPGLGDPLIGVDVTEDGQWVLGTTSSYLLVIPTTMPGGGTGFEERMGDQKPIPRKLQLRYEDIVRLGIQKVRFAPARFNLDETTNEQRIVTSTGPYLITWNFRKVKQNKLDEYKIKRMKETVVDGQFVYGDDKSIVVATKTDVELRRLKSKK